MDNYQLYAHCKSVEKKCNGIIGLNAVEGFALAGSQLTYNGPPIHLRCGVCGEIHNYTLRDVRLAPKASSQ